MLRPPRDVLWAAAFLCGVWLGRDLGCLGVAAVAWGGAAAALTGCALLWPAGRNGCAAAAWVMLGIAVFAWRATPAAPLPRAPWSGVVVTPPVLAGAQGTWWRVDIQPDGGGGPRVRVFVRRRGAAPRGAAPGLDAAAAAAPPEALQPGTRVQVSRDPAPPAGPRNPGDPDWRPVLAADDVAGEVWLDGPPEAIGPAQGASLAGLVRRWRDRLLAVQHVTLRAADAALLQALLFGERSGLAATGEGEAFRAAGFVHLLAVSGLHVSFLAAAVQALVRHLGWAAGSRATVALAVTWLYAALADFTPSVLRAALMLSWWLAAQYLGRPRLSQHALALAAVLLAGWDPDLLWDPAYQLSFAATAGLLLLREPLLRALWRDSDGGRDCDGGGDGDGGRGGGGRGEVRPSSAAGWWRRLRILVPRHAVEAVATGLSAQLAVLPLLANHFGQVALYGPVGGVLAVPLADLILVLGLLGDVLGLFWLPLAWAIHVPCGWALAALNWLAAAFAGLPGALLDVPQFPLPTVAGYYGLLAWVLGLWPRNPAPARPRSAALAPCAAARAPAASPAFPTASPAAPPNPGLRLAIRLGASLLILCLCYGTARLSADRWLVVTFLDVGQGDAMVLFLPGGRTIVVDGGPRPRAAETTPQGPGSAPLLDYLRRQGVRRVDALVLTHPHADHYNGLLPVLRRLPIGAVWQSGLAAEQEGFQRVREEARRRRIPWLRVQRGQLWQTPAGVAIEVLNPPAQAIQVAGSDAVNDNSVVLRVTYGDLALLLTGDLGPGGERVLLASGTELAADVLKVAHHGSAYSSGRAFLEAVGARWAVIEVGTSNRYGHPAGTTLRRLAQAGSRVWRTDRMGGLQLVSDGQILFWRSGHPSLCERVQGGGARRYLAWTCALS